MPDYRIPVPTPTPIQQLIPPNPIENLSQGIQAGSQMGLHAKQLDILDQYRQAQIQAQQDKDFDSFTKSLQVIHNLPGRIREDYWNGVIVPRAQKIGMPLAQGWDPKADDPILDEANQLVEAHKKNPDLLSVDDLRGGLHMLVIKAQESGDKDNEKTLMDIARDYPKGGGADAITLTPDQNKALYSGDPDQINKAFPSGVPLSVAKAGITPYDHNVVPTTQSRNMGETAATVLPHIDQLRNVIHQAAQAGYIGPAAGRIYSQFLIGKVGSTGDDAADRLLGRLRSLSSLTNTAMLRTHFGARGGQQMYEHFADMLNTGKQSEAVLNGALDTFEDFAKGYAKAGGVDVPATDSGGGLPGLDMNALDAEIKRRKLSQ